MDLKKSIDFIIENSSNPYLKEIHGDIDQNFTMEDVAAICEYEYGLRLAASIKNEFELLKRNEVIEALEQEHGNSLALIIETETQKYELEELKKKLEILTVKLKNQTIVDGLTNVANRRHFDNFLNSAWRSAIKDSQTLSILMVDVDYFKLYNDHYGHLKGDDCLKQVARSLSQFGNRARDLLARYGGEEFVFILADTTKFHLLNIAENVRQSVENMNISHEHSPISSRVTISVGAAMCTPSGERSPEALLMAADQGLYKAKEMGRNIVCFHEISS